MKDLQLLLYFVGVHSCETSCRKKSRELDCCNGDRREFVSAVLSILIEAEGVLDKVQFYKNRLLWPYEESNKRSLIAFPDGYCFDILNRR